MTDKKPLIYTAQSKQHFYCREAVCEFVFQVGAIPLNPFQAFGYFLGDRVKRDWVRHANRELLERCDEVWVFGEQLADGVVVEIAQALTRQMPVRYFSIGSQVHEIKPLSAHALDFEFEVLQRSGMPRIALLEHLANGSTGDVVKAMGRGREILNE